MNADALISGSFPDITASAFLIKTSPLEGSAGTLKNGYIKSENFD
jgi:hypothetical protein